MGEEDEVTSEQLVEILNAADSMHEKLRDANSVKIKYKIAKSVIARTKSERDKLSIDVQVAQAELEKYKSTCVPLSVKQELDEAISELTQSYNTLVNSSEIRYQSLSQELRFLKEKHCKELDTMRIQYEKSQKAKKCKSDEKVKLCLEEEREKNSMLEKKLAGLEEHCRRIVQSQEQCRRECDNKIITEVEKTRTLEASTAALNNKIDLLNVQLRSVTKERDILIEKLENNSLTPIQNDDDLEYITFGSEPTPEKPPDVKPLVLSTPKETSLVIPEVILTTDENIDLPLLQETPAEDSDNSDEISRILEEMRFSTNMVTPMSMSPCKSVVSVSPCKSVESVSPYKSVSASPSKSKSVSPSKSKSASPSKLKSVSPCKLVDVQMAKTLKSKGGKKLTVSWRKRMNLRHRKLEMQLKRLQKFVSVGSIARSVKARLLRDKRINVRNTKEIVAVNKIEASTQVCEEPKQPPEATTPKKRTLLENLQKWRVDNYLSYPSAESDLEAPGLARKKKLKKQKAKRLHDTSEEDGELTDTIYTKSQGSVDSGYFKDSDSDSDVPLDKLANLYKKQKCEEGGKVRAEKRPRAEGPSVKVKVKMEGVEKKLDVKAVNSREEKVERVEEGRAETQVVNLPAVKKQRKCEDSNPSEDKRGKLIIHSVKIIKPAQNQNLNAVNSLETKVPDSKTIKTPKAQNLIKIVSKVGMQARRNNPSHTVEVQKVQGAGSTQRENDEDYLIGFNGNYPFPEAITRILPLGVPQEHKTLLDEIISVLERTPVKVKNKNSTENIVPVTAETNSEFLNSFEINSSPLEVYSINNDKTIITVSEEKDPSSIKNPNSRVSINEARTKKCTSVANNNSSILKFTSIGKDASETKEKITRAGKKVIGRKKKLSENANPRSKISRLSEDLPFSDSSEETTESDVSKVTEIVISPKKLSPKERFKIAKQLALDINTEKVEKRSFKRPNARRSQRNNSESEPPQRLTTELAFETWISNHPELISSLTQERSQTALNLETEQKVEKTSFKRPNTRRSLQRNNSESEPPQKLNTEFKTSISNNSELSSTTQERLQTALNPVTEGKAEKTSFKRPNARKSLQTLNTEPASNPESLSSNDYLRSVAASTRESSVLLTERINAILENVERAETDENSIDGESSGEEDEPFESPASPEPDFGETLVGPTIIPLCANTNTVPERLEEDIVKKLLHFPKQKDVATCVLEHFTNKPPELTAKLILKIVSQDIYSPVEVFNHRRAPYLSVTQQLMLGLLLALEEKDGGAVIAIFMKLAEQRILALQDAECISPVARVHAAVCKLRFDYSRMRGFICKAFACMGDLALHYFYVVLTSWLELVPHRSALSGQGSVEVRTLVQLARLRQCTSQHNLMLLLGTYGFPFDREDSAELLEELCCYYLSAERHDSLFCLIVALCQSIEEKTVIQQLQTLKADFTLVTNERHRCDVIKLIGCIRAIHKSSSLSSIEQWLEQFANDAHEDIRSSSKYVLNLAT